MAERLGVKVGDLLAYTPELDAPPLNISWDQFHRVQSQIERYAPTEKAQFDLGQAVLEAKPTLAMLEGVSLFLDPFTFMLSTPRLGLTRLFPFLEVAATREGHHVRIRMALPSGALPSRSFFATAGGMIAQETTLIGLEPSEVIWTTDGRCATYWVRPPPSGTLWARLGRALRLLFRGDQVHAQLLAQQRELEEQNVELERALAEKEAALSVRDRFLQLMGHELRTPLNGLLHSLETRTPIGPARAFESSPEIRDLLDSASRLSTLLQSVLTYAQLAGGDIGIRIGPSEPAALLELAVRRLRASAEAKGVRVVAAVHASAAGFWSLDGAHLHRVLAELGKNAIAASPRGAKVEFAVSARDGALEFEVLDDGIGMSESLRAAAFEPFQMGQEDGPRPPGSAGLGLAIVAATAAGLGGSAALLPRSPGICARVRVPAEPAETPAPPPPARGRRVLVVDDDRINRAVARRLLLRLGCEVEVAEDGEEAIHRLEIAQLEKVPFDLVLMDCEMPRLDGWAATAQIRASGAILPVVAATAYASETDRSRCFEAGMTDFLQKPLDPILLDSILRRWLGADQQPK